jgi:16S rRNA (uracil1498-N3)-methyltransferase
MIRLFVTDPLSAGAEIVLGPDQSHYLATVMRQGVGASVRLFNGTDGEWSSIITRTGKRAVALRPVERTRPQDKTPDLELIIAAVKRSRLETIIEKAAELGCRAIHIVSTDRTNAERVRPDRLSAIAVEASEQTGRLDAPQVHEQVKLARLLDGWDANRRILFCDEAGDAKPVAEAVAGSSGPWAVLIGPEGGFSKAERDRLRLAPYVIPATLGPRILRADTAAIAALTLWQATCGDWRT